MSRECNDEPDRRSLTTVTSTRRNILKSTSGGILGAIGLGGAAGVTSAQSSTGGTDNLRFQITQGGETHRIDALTSQESVADVYDSLDDSVSEGTGVFALVDGADGLHLVVRNRGDQGADGEISYSFDELPSEGS